jgi:YD repeat-containing protein
MDIDQARQFPSVPTLDTERRSPFGSLGNWSPNKIDIFGHLISIDIPTGNLTITTTDVAYPYYNFSLGVSRSYDVQEQKMQQSYLRNYTNVNPKPHLFANWKLGYEADADEVWHNSLPELHVTSGIGAEGLFEMKAPMFRRNLTNDTELEETMRTYGIPSRTLQQLGWHFTRHDFLLRTFRGPFKILTGNYRGETLVDDVAAEMWLFNPISGTAARINSTYFFNIVGNSYREVGCPLLVTNMADALGHQIDLRPTATAPPYNSYVLSDGSGRELTLELNRELTFPDGLKTGRQVRRFLVSRVVDTTRPSYNTIDYTYGADNLLDDVTLPSSLGHRHVRYRYADMKHPGVLTAIENSAGDTVQFEYSEDPIDNDERLRPRLKIRKITDPEGITFEYDYAHKKNEVTCTILYKGIVDRRIKYQYIRDTRNTKRRYVTLTENQVTRGYIRKSTGVIVQRQPSDTQIIRRQTQYTNDGRFNVSQETDPLGRIITYEKYNDFNQVERKLNFEGHWTEYTYDIPAVPLPSHPIRYDLRKVESENIVRTMASIAPASFQERIDTIRTQFTYSSYDAVTSLNGDDHGKQSTHRILEKTDERGHVWSHGYDDLDTHDDNHDPLSPTSFVSPLGIVEYRSYNNRGELDTITDPEGNFSSYRYNALGQLEEHTDPNQGVTLLTYYPEANWLYSYTDQNSKLTKIIRDAEGRITELIDPVGDSVRYEYYKNGRVQKIIHRRPAVPTNLSITPYGNLETVFEFSPLGSLTLLRNPKGLELMLEYDEEGRMFQWSYNAPNAKPTRYLYDAAGQVECVVDRKNGAIEYTYHKSGYVKSLQYPPWNDGVRTRPGKLVEYLKYDYRGRVLSMKDSEVEGTQEFVYDEAGNLIVRKDADGFLLEFAYDNDNRLEKIADSSGDYQLSLTLDDLGRPQSLKDSSSLDGSLTWDYTYEKSAGAGRRALNLYERSAPTIGLSSRFDFDKKNRLTALSHLWTSRPGQPIYSQAYGYRDDDMLAIITGDDANEFGYDGIKQLISVVSQRYSNNINWLTDSGGITSVMVSVSS